MKRSSESTAPVVLAVAVLTLAVLAAYVAGYFRLCQRRITDGDECYRVYAAQWQATIYQPAAYVESLVTRKQVETRAPLR